MPLFSYGITKRNWWVGKTLVHPKNLLQPTYDSVMNGTETQASLGFNPQPVSADDMRKIWDDGV